RVEGVDESLTRLVVLPDERLHEDRVAGRVYRGDHVLIQRGAIGVDVELGVCDLRTEGARSRGDTSLSAPLLYQVDGHRNRDRRRHRAGEADGRPGNRPAQAGACPFGPKRHSPTLAVPGSSPGDG